MYFPRHVLWLCNSSKKLWCIYVNCYRKIDKSKVLTDAQSTLNILRFFDLVTHSQVWKIVWVLRFTIPRFNPEIPRSDSILIRRLLWLGSRSIKFFHTFKLHFGFIIFFLGMLPNWYSSQNQYHLVKSQNTNPKIEYRKIANSSRALIVAALK